MVFLLISMFWRNALIPFVTDFGAALCLIITGASQSYSSNIWLKIINPYSLLANRILFGKTEFIGFAGYPIQSFLAAIIFAIILGMDSGFPKDSFSSPWLLQFSLPPVPDRERIHQYSIHLPFQDTIHIHFCTVPLHYYKDCLMQRAKWCQVIEQGRYSKALFGGALSFLFRT